MSDDTAGAAPTPPNRNPLAGRSDVHSEPDHPLVAPLRALRRDHALLGAVLISFYLAPDGSVGRIGVNSSGTGEFGQIMSRLGDLLLAAIAAGDYDRAGEPFDTSH